MEHPKRDQGAGPGRPPTRHFIARAGRTPLRRHLWCLALAWALVALAQDPAYAQEQITTDHFYIYYQKRTENTARQVADIADEAYDRLSGLFKFHEDHPMVHVIIRDDMDFGNGWTDYFENVITIWATNLDSEVRGTHDWVKHVFVHELTHLISLNIASKGPINFGAVDIGRQNEEVDFAVTLPAYHMAVPQWFTEGISQYQDETLGHESWDTHRDMLLRMAVLENDLLSLGEMGVFAHDGFHSEMVYNQGYALTRYIGERFGPGKVETLVRHVGLLNFNSSIRRTLGVSPSRLYHDWKEKVERDYSARRTALGAVVEGEPLADDGFLEFYPVYSPDGTKLAYLSSEDRDYDITKIRIKDLKTGKTRTLDKKVYSRPSWTLDSRKLVYARLGGSTQYFDLFVYDLETDKEERISAGLRAKDPSVSPDGRQIVFVRNEGGNNNLGLVNVDGTDVRYLTNNRRGMQFYTPQWSPDGQRILFGVYRGEDRDVATISAECTPYSKKVASEDSSAFPDSLVFPVDADFRVVANSDADERDGCWSPDGERVLFASDREGVFNLYEIALENGEVRQVSNVLGGVFAPSVSPDGAHIAYVGYHAANHSVYRLDRGAYQEARAWERSERDYRTLAKQEPIEDEYDVGPYSRRYSLSGVYPIVSLGPTFIGEKVGLETLSAGVQVGVGDVLGANQLVTAFSLGRNLKKDMDWNTDFEAFYSRRLGSVFTQHSVLAPTAYAYLNRVTLNDKVKESARQDTTIYEPFDGSTLTLDIDWESWSEETAKYDYTRTFYGLQVPLDRRQALGLEYGYHRYSESLAGLYTITDRSRFYEGSVDITQEIKQGFPDLVIDTTLVSKERIQGLDYFTSHEIALYWSYVDVKPTQDGDINPSGGRRVSLALRRTASVVTDSLTYLDSEGITTEYKKDDEELALYEVVGSWQEFVRVPFGRDALSLWLLAGYKNRNIRTREEGGAFFWPLRYYLGGQGTLRGYPHFAVSGSKVLFARAAYTFPIFQNIDRQFLNFYFDKLYGSVFAEAGAAWNWDSPREVDAADFLRDVGVELKMRLFTFYRLPLEAYFQVVRPLDKSRLERMLGENGLDAREKDLLDETYKSKFYFGLRLL